MVHLAGKVSGVTPARDSAVTERRTMENLTFAAVAILGCQRPLAAQKVLNPTTVAGTFVLLLELLKLSGRLVRRTMPPPLAWFLFCRHSSIN